MTRWAEPPPRPEPQDALSRAAVVLLLAYVTGSAALLLLIGLVG